MHAKHLSTLDLLKGYWQVPVSESSQPKTAFVTPLGKYKFKVMPFGLVGAPATFQRLMNEILSPVREFAIAYMDDICIFSASWTEHLKHLRKIFQLMEDAGLTVNLKKCRLGRTSVTYLGHTIGAAGIRPSSQRPPSTNNKERCESLHRTRKLLPQVYSEVCRNSSTTYQPHTQDRARQNRLVTGTRRIVSEAEGQPVC